MFGRCLSFLGTGFRDIICVANEAQLQTYKRISTRFYFAIKLFMVFDVVDTAISYVQVLSLSYDKKSSPFYFEPT